MTAKDLMVGDWVLDTYTDKPMRIEGINGGNPRFGQDLEPIPLTPEILEKNGFKKKHYSLRFDLTTSEGYVNIDMQKGMIYINGKDGNNVTHYGELYLHELQHALRLCGIDKEIVL